MITAGGVTSGIDFGLTLAAELAVRQLPSRRPSTSAARRKSYKWREVFGSVRAGARRQLFDTPLALPEMLEQFEPVCMAQRVRDLREAGVSGWRLT